MSNLTHEQARFFRDSGYYRLDGVLNIDETAELREFVSREKQLADTAMPIGEIVTKLYGLYDRSPELMHKVISHPNILDPVQSIVGPNVIFTKNRHNHATVNDSRSTKLESRLHRDILQPTRGLVTAAIYLEDTSLENGCTHIVPGSHNLPYVGVPQEDGGGTWMDEHGEYAGLEDQALPVPMREGGVLLFNGLAFHGVGTNSGNGTRMSITLGFRAADELAYHADQEREILVSGDNLYRGNDR